MEAGILDVLGTIVAVEDVFLSHVKTVEKILERELKLALTSVYLVLNLKRLKDLEASLLSAGLAMKNTSRYCSGSEHEIEKCLAENFPEYMHGELVGVGSLIAAKLYENISEKGLIFDAKALFEELVKIYKKCGVLSVVKEILSDERIVKEAPELMRKVSTIRPERYTLWNVIRSENVNFEKLLREIREVL
jgi:glycerol dehydrogenase-like iron-containing ADH family enzyme